MRASRAHKVERVPRAKLDKRTGENNHHAASFNSKRCKTGNGKRRKGLSNPGTDGNAAPKRHA